MQRLDLTHSLPPHIYDAWSNKIRLATHIFGSILIQLNNMFQNIRLFYRPDLFTPVYMDDCHQRVELGLWD